MRRKAAGERVDAWVLALFWGALFLYVLSHRSFLAGLRRFFF